MWSGNGRARRCCCCYSYRSGGATVQSGRQQPRWNECTLLLGMTSGPPRRDFGLITLTSRQLVHVEHLQDTHMSHKCLVYVTREPKHTHLISSLSAGLAGVPKAEGVGLFEEADSSSCLTLPAPPWSPARASAPVLHQSM